MLLLDFSRLLPAPLGTRILAEKGLRVVKIELPHKPDPVRLQPPFDDQGRSTLYQLLNQGKELVELDYTRYGQDPETTAILDEWLRQADVLVEQYRPGVMSAWGLGYEQLQKRYPQLIYASVSGYGQQGDLSQEAGHDLTYLAYSGLLHLNRDERGKPVVPNFQAADIAGGAQPLVIEVLSALLQRQNTGLGLHLDISMTEQVRNLAAIARSQELGGWDPARLRLLGGGLVNYNVYACSDGKWIALAALERKFWRNFCLWAQRPDWLRDHELELSAAVFPQDELIAFFARYPQNYWIEQARGKDVCIAPVVENLL